MENPLTDDDYNLLDRLYAPNSISMAYKFEKCVQYLCLINDPAGIFNDERAYRVMKFLRDYSEDNDDLVKIILEYKSLIEVLSNILLYYISDLKLFLSSYSKSSKAKLTDEQERQYMEEFDFMEELIYLLRNLTNKSKTICYKFHDNNGTKALLDYLNDDALVKRMLKLKQRMNKNETSMIRQVGYHLLMGILGIMFNLSYIADYRKKDFEDLKATSIIVKFTEHIKADESARVLVFVTLANLANDTEIETILNTKQTIDDIMKLIRIGADTIAEKTGLKRIRVDIDFDEDNEIYEDICLINEDWTICDLLLALHRLAINDRLKSIIYDEHNIKIELEKIFSYGNSTEKEYSAKLLWQLCFDKTIAKKVHEEELLYAYIEDISNREDVENKNLQKYCKGMK